MADISPELLEDIRKAFERNLDNSAKIKGLASKLNKGTATYKEADEYAVEVGDALARAYQKILSVDTLPDGKMYYNIAQAVLQPTLEFNHEIVADYATAVQQTINKEAGLGLNAVRPELDQNRVDGLIDKVSSYDDFNQAKWLLNEPIRNFSQNVVDETVRKNADFQYKSGLSPKIIRTAEPPGTKSYTRGKRRYTYRVPCQWCASLAGTYDYSPGMDRNVFRRHEMCRCNVEYSPDGLKRQNVWSKKWTDEETLAKRKTVGLDNGQRLTPEQRIDQTKALNNYTSKWVEYYRNAQPGSGEIITEPKAKPTEIEKSTAELLHNEIGGDIIIREERNGVRNPDYLWRGSLWDQYTAANNSYNSLDKAIQDKLRQIDENPGGIIIEWQRNDSYITGQDIIKHRLERSAKSDVDIIITKDGQIVSIMGYRVEE